MSRNAGIYVRLIIIAGFLMVSRAAVSSDDPLWRPTDPKNIVYMELDDGLVIVELNPGFAPKTVTQFRRLIRDGFYGGLSFYRVIDGFVAQAGDGSDMGEPNSEPPLEAEFEREWSDQLPFVSVQAPDLFAPETGFIDGVPVGRQKHPGLVWITHCPGTVAMARQTGPNTGSTDFYIVIGQAPRYLDRNLSVFGRVIHGMEVVQKIRRGAAQGDGMIADAADRSKIKSMKIAADVPADEQLTIDVIATDSEGFKDQLQSRRQRDHEFFVHSPPAVLDICQIPVQSRIGFKN